MKAELKTLTLVHGLNQGYMFSLRYGGDYQDPSKRGPLGTVLNGITAIDALDGRYIRPFDLRVQLRPKHMLRELNKAAGALCDKCVLRCGAA